MSREAAVVKGYQAMARGLADLGVEIVFGVTGAANVLLADVFIRECGQTYVPAAHEAGALSMALGFASTSGELGVATVTQGPGLTNGVTALVDGVRARTPLMLLAVDTPIEDKFHFQRVDQRSVVSSTGAGFEQARSTRTLLRDLAVAAQRAVIEQRPVVFNVPSNLFHSEVSYELSKPAYPLRQPGSASREAIEQAVAVLAAARRPVVLAGRGAIEGQTRDALLAFATRIGAPLATTLRAKGLFQGDPFDLDILGTLSSDRTSDVIGRSDCLVAFGASLNYKTTLGGDLLQGKRIVQCDADPGAIGARWPVDAGLVGDCGLVAKQLCAVLDEAGVEPAEFRSDEMADQHHRPAPRIADDRSTDTTVDLRTFLLRLEEAVPRNRVLVTDGGNFVQQAWQLLTVEDPHLFVMTQNFGALGIGMGYAIGAAYGAPSHPVLLVMGDGGFTLGGLTEFNTAVRNGTDLIAVICNNGAYGTEYYHLLDAGLPPSVAQFDWPDFASVAKSLGGVGVTVRCLADIDVAIQAIADRDRPVLIDVRIDPQLDTVGMAVSAR